MEHTKPRQLPKSKSSKKEPPTSRLGDTSDASLTRSTLQNRHGPKSYKHFSDTLKVGFKLKQAFQLELKLPQEIYINLCKESN